MKILALIMMLLWLVLFSAPRSWTEQAIAEYGPIELATALGYFIAAAMLWMSRSNRRWSTEGIEIVFLITGGLREMDIQRITSSYAVTLPYFLTRKTPVWEMLLVIAVLSLLLVLGLRLVLSHGKGFVAGLKARQSANISVAFALGLMCFTVALDRFAAVLNHRFGGGANPMVYTLWIFEETLELTIPVFFCLAVIQSATHHAEESPPHHCLTRNPVL